MVSVFSDILMSMKFMTRGKCLLLVLVILISQTALLAHAITHIGKDSLKCVLCVCQAQQAHGLPSTNFHLPGQPGHFSLPDTIRYYDPVTEPVRPYFQRAPPVIA